MFKWQGDLRKQPDWRESSFVASNVSESEIWSYLPGTENDDRTISDAGQYMGDPGGRRRLPRASTRRKLRELYTKRRIIDWCEIAIETWTKQCYLAAVAACDSQACNE